jgi:hypothetical protein
MDQLVIDLIDFRAMSDGKYKWVLQKKDLLLRYIWLDPLKDKTASAICDNLEKWFSENRYP